MTMTRRLRDEVIGACSQFQSMVSSVTGVAPVPSEFESIVLLSRGLPPKDGDLISILLASASLMHDRGCEVLRPLWAEEAVHRIHGFMRLLDARSRRVSLRRQNPIAAGVEDFAARDLAVRLRELEAAAERAMLPCSAVLRDVVSDLGALFGCPANIMCESRIECVSLPGYKRRALVLAACELLCNALLHAFPECETGLIEVELTRRDRGSASLRVTDNGIGFSDMPPNLACGVAAGLADLLEADLAYARRAGTTIAEIVFPVQDIA